MSGSNQHLKSSGASLGFHVTTRAGAVKRGWEGAEPRFKAEIARASRSRNGFRFQQSFKQISQEACMQSPQVLKAGCVPSTAPDVQAWPSIPLPSDARAAERSAKRNVHGCTQVTPTAFEFEL